MQSELRSAVGFRPHVLQLLLARAGDAVVREIQVRQRAVEMAEAARINDGDNDRDSG